MTSGSLVYTAEDGATTSISLAAYLDEDSRAITSGVLNATSGVVTFTRDDSTTFTLNHSALLDDTNLVTSVAGKSGVVTLVKGDVGLGNVTNESKATMFTGAALTGNSTATTQSTGNNSTRIATTAYVKGQNYLTSVTASDVGLGNVTNESKATMFASPTFTGTPLAPTPCLLY